METILSSLIQQVKNPWQYILVGGVHIVLIYYKVDKQYFVWSSAFCMGIAYLFELIMQVIKNYVKEKLFYFKNRKNILFNLLHMNVEEKRFIKECFFNNIQTYEINGMYNQIYKTLPAKNIAFCPSGQVLMNQIPITIPIYVWNIIKKHQKEIFPEIFTKELKNESRKNI